MSGSYIYATNSTTNIMSVLTQTSLDASTAASSKRFQLLSTLLQNQFTAKAAALTADSAPTASENFLQVEISGIAQQKSTFNTLQNQYGTNLPLLGDLSAQITALQNAVQAGDSAAFDATLGTANTDIANLTVVQPNPAVQDDGVTALKLNGLGVQSSATYDLSTPAGQAAALADINTAQQTVSQISSQTSINQIIASSKFHGIKLAIRFSQQHAAERQVRGSGPGGDRDPDAQEPAQYPAASGGAAILQQPGGRQEPGEPAEQPAVGTGGAGARHHAVHFRLGHPALKRHQRARAQAAGADKRATGGAASAPVARRSNSSIVCCSISRRISRISVM